MFLFFKSRFKTWHNTFHFQFQQTFILIEVASRRLIYIQIELTMIKLNSSNCDNADLFFLNKNVSCFELVIETIVKIEELIVCHWKSNVNFLNRSIRSRFIYIFDFEQRQRLRWLIKNQFVRDRYRVLETIHWTDLDWFMFWRKRMLCTINVVILILRRSISFQTIDNVRDCSSTIFKFICFLVDYNKSTSY